MSNASPAASPPASDAPADTVELPLRRLPLWSPGMTALATLAGCSAAAAAVNLVPRLWAGGAAPAELAVFGQVLLFWGTCLGLWAAVRLAARARPQPRVRLSADAIALPAGPEAWRHVRLALAEVVAVQRGGRRGRRATFIESGRRVVQLPDGMFADPQGPETLLLELRRRLLALPQGTALLEATERRRQVTLQALARRPYATQMVLGLVGVFFANTYLKGALGPPFGLVRWGANVPSLVRQGEIYRLVAANFLHVSALHALLNGWALYYLGPLIERLLGWPRFVVLLAGTGVAAMAATALSPVSAASVGASGAVFGLLGAFAVLSVRLRGALPLSLRQPRSWWLTLAGVNLVLPALWPVVDVRAHLAGAAVGVAVALAMLGRQRALPAVGGRLWQGAGAAVAAVGLAALAQAVVHAAREPPEAALAFARQVVHDPEISSTSLNNLAWAWTLDRDSGADELALAAEAAGRAVAEAPEVAAFVDTAATVASLQGHHDEAIAGGRRALDLAVDDPQLTLQLAAQLVRFYDARPRPRPRAAAAVAPAAAAAPQLEVDEGAGALVLRALPPAAAAGLEVDAALRRGDGRALALVRLRVGEAAAVPSRHADPLVRPLGGQARLRLEVLEARPARPAAAAGSVAWQVVPLPHRS